MAEQKEKHFYDYENKVAYGLYAFDQLKDGKVTDEAKVAGSLHLKKSRSLDDLARELSEDPERNLLTILKSDTQQYQEYIGELTVSELLTDICKKTGYGEGYAPEILKHGQKRISELQESAKKHSDAVKAYMEAKTPEEAAKALTERQKHEEETGVYQSLMQYNDFKLRSYVTPEIAREAIKYDMQKKYEFGKKKAA